MIENNRKATPPIKVCVTLNERNEIRALAAQHKLSMSRYLRDVGLGIQVISKLDKALVADLAKLNADQGRLGGLLKLWLTNDEKLAKFDQEVLVGTIEKALETIYANQSILLEKVSKL
jgi:hypothetical protein